MAAEAAESSNPDQRVRDVISRHLNVESVGTGASLRELGCDSLDVVEIATLLEDEFGVIGLGDDWTVETWVGEVMSDVAQKFARRMSP